LTLYVNLIYFISIYVFILFLYIMNFQEKYDILDKEILQAAKERNFKLKDEKVKIQKRIAYLLSLENQIKDSDKKILKLSKEWKSNEEIENELSKQENLQYKLDIAVKNDYHEVCNEVNGHRIIEWSEWYWLIDNKWEEITKEKYDSVWNFNKYGVALVKKNRKYWLIDEKWDLVTPIIYETIKEFSEWFAVVIKDGKSWLIDAKWNVILPIIYSDLSSVKGWNLLFRDGDRFRWMINTKWEILHNPEFDYFSELLNNWYAIVEKNNKKWLLNNKWELIVSPKYTSIRASDVLNWWLIGVEVYGKGGTKCWKVTPEGEEVIAPIYDKVEEIWWLEWVYKVKLQSKNSWEYEWLIDKNGNVIVTPDKYYHICDFESKQDWRKFSEVWLWDRSKAWDKKWLIDETWKEVIRPLYGQLAPLHKHDDYYKVSKQKLFWKNKVGYVDLEWNEYFWEDAKDLENQLFSKK